MDLNYFTFNASRFKNSYDVQTMTDAEVGQYILLLCESWLLGKNCTLPDDLPYLARVAHCSEVSPKVLAKFPVTGETGVRRNPVLYAEWCEVTERLRVAQESGSRGGLAKAASRVPIGCLEGPSRVTHRNPLPIEREREVKEREVIETVSAPVSRGGQFKNIATHYSSYFGVSHSHARKVVDRYLQACSEYGEDVVLKYFDQWAESNEWLREKRDTFGLNFFWSRLEELVEADRMRQERETKRTEESREDENNLASITAVVDAQIEKERERLEQESIAQKEHEAFLEANKDRMF